MRILAFYLPQYHPIQENDMWWGAGFTEWTNVKSARPTYRGQNMPRVPLDHRYYSLLDTETMVWQSKLAKKYGIYGFVYYHYWFEEGMLLERPAELMLRSPEVDIPFCFSWANHTWRREWANKSNEVLREQTYGDEHDWRRHFDYLLPFFRDGRYIRIEGKPLMILYNPRGVREFPPMMRLWQELARESGLPGIFFLHQENEFDHHREPGGELYEGGIEFQMNRAVKQYIRHSPAFACERVLNRLADKVPSLRCKATTMHYTYDRIWKIVLRQKPKSDDWYPGAFVDWDNTPRRKNRGQLCTGVTPEKFERYLTRQVRRAREVYGKDYLFMFAWNEWGESGYLEPDEGRRYAMLEAVRSALIANDEFPKWD